MELFHAGFKGAGNLQFWIGVGALWLFSAAVSAMDAPRTGDSRFYGWLYRFTHLLAANLDRAIGGNPFRSAAPDYRSGTLQHSNTEQQGE
ncbi:MAG TPA: hypothetical protein VHT24_13205 [Pseudacidobacterium sp.]|nr:hypothetical protein [Pseudacidobacterium sp.]